MSCVRLNVSGTRFEIDITCLEKDPFQRLPALVLDAKKTGTEEITIRRPAESFSAILAYYQTGELHLPPVVCPGAFKKELEYWGIGSEKLSECCIFRYFAFFAEQDTLRKFCQTVLRDKKNGLFENSAHVPVKSCNSARNFRRRLWDIIDNNESSIWSKLYFCAIFCLVLLSIFILAYGTEPMFQRKLTRCELIEYYRNTQNPDLNKVIQYLGNPDCNQENHDDFVPFDENESFYFYWNYAEYMFDDNMSYYGDSVGTTSSTSSHSTIVTNPTKTFSTGSGRQKEKIHLPYFMIQNRAFDMLEKITLALFTLDFLLRISSCPSILRYFLSLINIVDFIALLGTYVHVIVVNIEKEQRYLDNWLDITMYFQILRTFRLFRVVKNVRAAKVLVYSIKQSLRDLLVLVMFLLIAVCTFASIVYLAEDRTQIKSIPAGWWWALITLTTVGYGDIAPKTGPGRFIGSLCAVSGVILISLTLPIFVNNFLTLYNYAEVDEILKKNTKLVQEAVISTDTVKGDICETVIKTEAKDNSTKDVVVEDLEK